MTTRADRAGRSTSDNSTEYGGWTLDDVCLVGYPKLPLCGDGVVDDGEDCDDGNTVDGDGCSAVCTTEAPAGGGGCCSAQRDARARSCSPSA